MDYQIVGAVTVTEPAWRAMALLWAGFIRAHEPDCRVRLFHQGLDEAALQALSRLDVEASLLVAPRLAIGKVARSRFAKLYAMCQMNVPYVFVDTDAYVLGSLRDLWTIAEGPIACAPHLDTAYVRAHGNKPNSGVVVVRDPDSLSWPRLAAHGRRGRWVFDRDDQGLLGACVPELRARYFSTRFNARARYCRIVPHPDLGRVRAYCELASVPDALGPGHEVVVCHFYGRHAKPWHVGDPVYERSLVVDGSAPRGPGAASPLTPRLIVAKVSGSGHEPSDASGDSPEGSADGARMLAGAPAGESRRCTGPRSPSARTQTAAELADAVLDQIDQEPCAGYRMVGAVEAVLEGLSPARSPARPKVELRISASGGGAFLFMRGVPDAHGPPATLLHAISNRGAVDPSIGRIVWRGPSEGPLVEEVLNLTLKWRGTSPHDRRASLIRWIDEHSGKALYTQYAIWLYAQAVEERASVAAPPGDATRARQRIEELLERARGILE